jgi:hypothetical protein
MPLYSCEPVANGLRTDHPVPDLPFVDDSHIPVDDPAAVEATGRRRGEGMWGRQDRVRHGGWVAYTTDPERHDLAWVVRWHPEHGRSVMLYGGDDGAASYTDFRDDALLFRAGGYWWDGTAWYRPSRVWDEAAGDYYGRAVPAAASVTAEGMLAGGGDASRGRALTVGELHPDTPYQGQWLDDLALWAGRRDGEGLAASVVTLSAPELAPGMLIGPAELAGIAGIASSTLRSYIARSEGRTPHPQVVIGNRSLWSRPVAEEWVEQRRRSPESVTEALSARLPSGVRLPVGAAEASVGLARAFYATLWENRPVRARWALRWRNAGAVREVADNLGYGAVDYMLRNIISTSAIATTVQSAVIDEFANGQRLIREKGPSSYAIDPGISQMLGWLIRYEPELARQAVGWIAGKAESRLGIPRRIVDKSLQVAIFIDGDVGKELADEFFYRVFTPASDQHE